MANYTIVDEFRRAVLTPIWEGPGLKEQFPEYIEAMPTEYVANVMMDLVQEGKYGGGSITTVMQDEIKVLPEDYSAAMALLNKTAAVPVRQALKAERGIA